MHFDMLVPTTRLEWLISWTEFERPCDGGAVTSKAKIKDVKTLRSGGHGWPDGGVSSRLDGHGLDEAGSEYVLICIAFCIIR